MSAASLRLEAACDQDDAVRGRRHEAARGEERAQHDGGEGAPARPPRLQPRQAYVRRLGHLHGPAQRPLPQEGRRGAPRCGPRLRALHQERRQGPRPPGGELAVHAQDLPAARDLRGPLVGLPLGPGRVRQVGHLEDAAARPERLPREDGCQADQPEVGDAERALRVPARDDARVEGGPDQYHVPQHGQRGRPHVQAPVDRARRRHRRRVDRVDEHRHGRQQDAHARLQRAHLPHRLHAPPPRDQPHEPLLTRHCVPRRRHLRQPGRHRLEACQGLVDRAARRRPAPRAPHGAVRQVRRRAPRLRAPKLPHGRPHRARQHCADHLQDPRGHPPPGQGEATSLPSPPTPAAIGRSAISQWQAAASDGTPGRIAHHCVGVCRRWFCLRAR